MNKLFPISLISLITLTLLSQAVLQSYGKENNKNEVKLESKQEKEEIKAEIKEVKGKTEIKIEVESEDEVETESKNEENKNKVKFLEKKDNEFKIWGPIQAFTTSSITIDGKTITIDTNALGKFKQVGVLKNGMYAKVEGKTIDEIMYAEKIIIDNRNKVSITPSVSVTSTPTVSVSPTPTATTTPIVSVTPEVTGSPTPTATETPTLEISSSDAFILDQMILNFQNLLRKLLRISEK